MRDGMALVSILSTQLLDRAVRQNTSGESIMSRVMQARDHASSSSPRSCSGRAATQIADGDSLLDKGIIDSTGVLELVAFIGETFGIQVADEELVADNFDSIDKLAAFVQAKGAGARRKANPATRGSSRMAFSQDSLRSTPRTRSSASARVRSARRSRRQLKRRGAVRRRCPAASTAAWSPRCACARSARSACSACTCTSASRRTRRGA